MLGAGRIDVSAAMAQVGGSSPMLIGDVNADQVVDFSDLTLVLGNFGSATYAGDATGDGSVGFDDLTLIIGNFEN